MRHTFVLFLIAITMLACGGESVLVMYDGERKAPEEVATIKTDNVYVMSIDTLSRKYQAISEKHIEVLPGQHVISVNYKSWKGRSKDPIELSFIAEKGHTYLVKASGGYRTWTAWIIDLATDSVVAGSP